MQPLVARIGFKADGSVRTAIGIARSNRRPLYRIRRSACNGLRSRCGEWCSIWKRKLDEHPVARIWLAGFL
jgi:hypothetical protein